MPLARPEEPTDPDEGLQKGDRLIRSADIVAEKQAFQVPVTLNVGDKQVIRLQGFTHVSTTLTQAPTGLADQVPAFNPLKLLVTDSNQPSDQPIDPGPALDDSDASFVTADLSTADPTAYKGGLSDDEAKAQVGDFAKAMSDSDKPLPLPPQLLLMRTSRATTERCGRPVLRAGELHVGAVLVDPGQDGARERHGDRTDQPAA